VSRNPYRHYTVVTSMTDMNPQPSNADLLRALLRVSGKIDAVGIRLDGMDARITALTEHLELLRIALTEHLNDPFAHGD
jgi:hypothetical protein